MLLLCLQPITEELIAKFMKLRLIRMVTNQHFFKPFYKMQDSITPDNMTDFYMKMSCVWKAMYKITPSLQVRSPFIN